MPSLGAASFNPIDMKQISKKTLLVNTFGTLGYLACVILWAWAGVVYLPMLLENEQVESFLLPTPHESATTAVSSFEMPTAVTFMAIIVAVLIMIVTVVVLIRIPISVARTGKIVTTKAADSALPIITKGRPLPKKEKKHLTVQLIKLIKLLLVIVPVAISSFGMLIAPPLEIEIVMLVSSATALIALFWFGLQYIAARLLEVDLRQLV